MPTPASGPGLSRSLALRKCRSRRFPRGFSVVSRRTIVWPNRKCQPRRCRHLARGTYIKRLILGVNDPEGAVAEFVVEFGKDGRRVEADGRLDAAAFHRNHQAIWAVLQAYLAGLSRAVI